MQKSRVIRFRLSEPLDTFLKDLVKEMRKTDPRWNKSELIRMIIQYFFMAHMMGELKKPFFQVKKDFFDYVETALPPNPEQNDTQPSEG